MTSSDLTEQAEELYQLASDAPTEVPIEDLGSIESLDSVGIGR